MSYIFTRLIFQCLDLSILILDGDALLWLLGFIMCFLDLCLFVFKVFYLLVATTTFK